MSRTNDQIPEMCQAGHRQSWRCGAGHQQAGHQQAGLALIELLLVLAIIAVLAAGIFVANQKRVTHTNSLQIEQKVRILMDLAQDTALNQQDFTGINMNSVSGLDSFPASFGTGPTFTMPGGATVTMGPATSGASPNDLLAVTLNNVPNGVCTEVATVLAPHMYNTVVNGAVVPLWPPATTQMPGRTEVLVSKLGCQAGTNTMTFRELKSLNPALFVEFDDIDRRVYTVNPQLQAQRSARATAMISRETVQQSL